MKWDWLTNDWMLLAGGGLLAATGLLVTIRALFADRSGGRRRCPKCWYDMRGTPGLRCSECGAESSCERRLMRTRRRWRTAILGLLFVASAVAAGAAPKARRDGLMSLVPTSVLVVLSPSLKTPIQSSVAAGQLRGMVLDELMRRRVGENLTGWQWRYVLENKGVLRVRERWPANLPLAVGFGPPHWLRPWPNIYLSSRLPNGRQIVYGDVKWGICGNAALGELQERAWQIIGTLPAGARSVALDVKVHAPDTRRFGKSEVWAGEIEMPIRAVATINEAIEPVNTEPLSGLVRQALAVAVHVYENSNGRTGSVALNFDRELHASLAEIAFGFSVDLIRDGETVGIAAICPASGVPYWGTELVQPDGDGSLTALSEVTLSDPAELSRWTVRIRGDGEMALRDWDRDKYWAGEFTVPLRDVLK